MDDGNAGASPAPANVYATMDASQTPIGKALATRESEVLDYQARKQQEYMEHQEAIRKLETEHPEARVGSDVMREEQPLWDPYLNWKAPPVAAREEAPKKPMGSGFSASAKSDLLSDPDTRRRVIAQTLFPNDPDAIYKVGFDAQGDPVYVGDDNKLHKIARGTERFGANITANIPEMAASIAGSFAGPWGTATATAGAHGIKRLVAGQIFDEPQDPWQNAKEMGIEGASALGGDVLGRVATGARNANRMAVEFPADEITRAQALRAQVFRETRVRLNLADASDDPFFKAVYQYGWRQPGQASRDLRAGRTANDLEFEAETNRVLDQIAAPDSAERTGTGAVNAAREAMHRAQTRANDIADPYYHAAWNAHPIVRDPTVLSFFNLPGFGEAYDEGLQLARMERVPLRPNQPPSLQTMDYWLRALKTRAANLRETDSTMAGAMQQRITELDNALTTAYPELGNARTVYRTARMALLEPLENGKVGVLASIDDPNARTAAAKIFADKDVSPQHIAETRRAIEGVNPDAWAGVSRQWLASKWDDALQRTQSAEQRNPPGKFQAEVFGTPRDEEIARAMLTPQAYQRFENLMRAARRLASTPVGGSTTPQDLAIGNALEGNTGVISSVVNAVRHPFKTGEDVARKAAREQNILHLTSAILDPAQARRLDVITRMRPGKQQAILLGSIVSEEAAKRFIQSEMAAGENSKLVAGDEDAVGVKKESTSLLPPEWWKKKDAFRID